MPRVAKIAKLPPEHRAWLRKALVKRGFGDIVELTKELNQMLAEAGIAETVGKSAVGNEAQRVKRLQEDVFATTEAARVLRESSRDDGDLRSEAIMATIQTDVWKVLLELRTANAIEDPMERLKALTKAASGVAEMSRARVSQSKWSTEIDARVTAAEEKVARLVRKTGADPKTIAEIRASILGITQRKPGAA